MRPSHRVMFGFLALVLIAAALVMAWQLAMGHYITVAFLGLTLMSFALLGRWIGRRLARMDKRRRARLFATCYLGAWVIIAGGQALSGNWWVLITGAVFGGAGVLAGWIHVHKGGG